MSQLRHALGTLALCVAQMAARGQDHAEIATPPNGGNQRAEVSQWIGLVKVTVGYHSPRVHRQPTMDRTGHIWGELVRYGFFDDGFGPSTATPWRAGANESTTITFSHDVQVAGRTLAAGTYGLFLEVEPTGPWTWIISTDASGWGSFQYDPRHDAVRAAAAPQDASFTEYLTYGFDERRATGATMYLQWENKRVPLRVEVPNSADVYVQQIRKDLLAWPGFESRNWERAAQVCVALNVNLDEALVWAEKAISDPFRGAAVGRAEFSTLQTKASVLRALGRVPESDAVMDLAFQMPDANAMAIYFHAAAQLGGGRVDRAMQLFRLNQAKHPKEAFWIALGFARGYTVTGDTAAAIKQWQVAIPIVPVQMKPNLPAFERTLAALKGARKGGDD